jgi:hypothetical protein
VIATPACNDGGAREHGKRRVLDPRFQPLACGLGPFFGLAVVRGKRRIAGDKLGDDLAYVISQIDVFRVTLDDVVAIGK